MKRIKTPWLVSLVCILFAIVSPFVYYGQKTKDIYPTAMEVVSIENDVVTVQTSTGIAYQFIGAEDLAVGDLVALIMDSKGTAEVFDDEILQVRYAGYWIE